MSLVTTDPALEYARERRRHWDMVAERYPNRGMRSFYHGRLEETYRFLVAPHQRVIEIGCAQGDLLASLHPEFGVGVDFSPNMIERAKDRHPELSI